MLTREICKSCNNESRVGFSVPDKIWKSIVPIHLESSVLCLNCFTSLGDQKRICWDKEIEFFPVSLKTFQS